MDTEPGTMNQEDFVRFFLNLPHVPQQIVLGKMNTHDIVNSALFSPPFKTQVNGLPKLTKEVTIHLFDELGVSIEEYLLNDAQSVNILQLTPLHTWTPEQQVELLTDLFNSEVTLKFNSLTASRENRGRMFRFFEDLNIVQIRFGEFRGHLRYLEELRPSTMRVMVLNNPGLPNFGAVFARQFNNLEFMYPLTLENILTINCKATEVWYTRFLEDGVVEILNRWINGWNPSLESFVVQFQKRMLQEDYIERIMANVRNSPAEIHEGHLEVISDSFLWIHSTSKDRAFTLRGTLVDGSQRTARIVFDTYHGAVRLKIIASN